MANGTSSPVPPQGWAVRGVKKAGTAIAANMGDITIPEKGSCVSISGDNGKTAYGIPIEADVAVDFISGFLKNFQIIHHSLKLDDIDFEKPLEKDEINKIKEIASRAQKFCEEVVQLNYGMTLDKNMALKLLSQPGCEALRFYLCSRTALNVSLVAVGTNNRGKDLNYKETEITNEDDNKIPFVTQSLVGDYVTPPGSGGLNKLFLSNNEDGLSAKEKACAACFVLLRMAKKRIKPING